MSGKDPQFLAYNSLECSPQHLSYSICGVACEDGMQAAKGTRCVFLTKATVKLLDAAQVSDRGTSDSFIAWF